MSKLLYKDLSYKLQGAIFKVYKTLGCSFKESVYQNALPEELTLEELTVEKEKRIDICYNNKKVGVYVPDLIVDDKIILELKAKEFLIKKDKEQFWHYLKGSKYKVGYLVNFGKPGGVEMLRRVYDTAREN